MEDWVRQVRLEVPEEGVRQEGLEVEVRQEGLQVVVVVEVVLDGHPGSFRQEVDFGYHHDQRLLVDLIDSYLVRREQIRLLCLLSLAEALEPLIMKAMTVLKLPRKAVVLVKQWSIVRLLGKKVNLLEYESSCE